MLFNSATIVAGLAVLMASTEVVAGGISMKLGVRKLWGCDGRQAPQPVRSRCSGRGSFFMRALGSTCCVNPNSGGTWHPGYDDDVVCPLGSAWGQHTLLKCCIPKVEQTTCDCGEGYTFNQHSLKCERTTSPSCGRGQWYNTRTGSCCDDSWENNPPRGNCPPGVSCPRGWFWHSGYYACRPTGCRTPEPVCPPGQPWNPSTHCCGTPTGPQPSKKPSRPHWKKDTQETFDHSLYCGNKKACSVPTEDGAWAYECLDTDSELESCGGCVADGEGKNCLDIPNVAAGAVTCDLGACRVSKCRSGFQVVNSTSCEGL